MSRVMLIGAAEGPLAAVSESLLQLLATSSPNQPALLRIPTIDDAIRGNEEPELIVVAQNWPDEYSTTDANRLISHFPLARLVVCFGPWSLADGRTRNIWPPAIRVSFEHSESRLRAEWKALTGKTAPSILLTSTADDVFLAQTNLSNSLKLSPSPVAILTPDVALGASWAESLAECGYQTVPVERAHAVIFDLDPWPSRRQTFCKLRNNFAGPMIGVTSEYGSDVPAAAAKAGAEQVLAKLGFPNASR